MTRALRIPMAFARWYWAQVSKSFRVMSCCSRSELHTHLSW
jgi:hypothetical protein